ncbi:hypothetical protein PANT_9c00319 [Moesziomyces antarcticus T-34]|uniref:Uncharacterized protein n=1 Tax=Pseudozyma antarctica (strain T-34) TaxID=1151754 RepID=M9MEW4_PSEA3|nr:hypothetical protein PANT_9c00319 [Moesziomyces antarcticus T-34]
MNVDVTSSSHMGKLAAGPDRKSPTRFANAVTVHSGFAEEAPIKRIGIYDNGSPIYQHLGSFGFSSPTVDLCEWDER